MSDTLLLALAPLAGLLALGYAFLKSSWISKQEDGTPEMREIAAHIAEGARAFLRREYRVLALFVVVVAALLAVANFSSETSSPLVALSFVVGALCSGLAGFIGMSVATKANVRTTHAARTGLASALNVAFSGGLVMGLSVVGLGLIGLSTLFYLYGGLDAEGATDVTRVLNILSGFSLGASSIALFARVGGGIYTKAADVGADLAGKVYEGIPEDDPRNPATIADNVGDNVGDVAGMGADLFESYVGAIVATMVLGVAFVGIGEFAGLPLAAILLPLVLSGVGILVSIVGALFVRVKEGGNPQRALNVGEFGAAGLMAVLSYFIITMLLPESWTLPGGDMSGFTEYTSLGVYFAVLIGLASGTAIGLITEHYTATDKKPVLGIARQSLTGAATTIIAGLGVGMISTLWPTLILAAAIIGSFHFAGLFGIAMAAVGMLSVLGIQLAVDAYGPISDNAGGIAEMAHLPPEVRERTDKLDAVGNTTAAIGKGFAIASAALTALALFAAFMQQAGIRTIDVSQPIVLGGVFIGAMLPYVFSALAMAAVGRAAGDMIKEVGRQFREIPGLREGTAKADYATCVDISTKAALREMVAPGLLAIVVPVAVGFSNVSMLAGLLVGVTVSGVLLAIFQSNAGGAWDNAKKQIEAGLVIDGVEYRKGSEAHKAAVVGDTVGDPLKDTSGPSLNILLKLISVVALVIAPLIRDEVPDASAAGTAAGATIEATGGTTVDGVAGQQAFMMDASGTDIVLMGAVADEGTRAAFVERVRALFPNLTVTDQMTVDPAVGPSFSAESLDGFFDAAGRVRRPQIALRGQNLVLGGTVRSDDQKASVDADASASVPTGYTYLSEVTVVAPSPEVAAAEASIAEALAEPVTFADGNAEFAGNSTQVLDRVADALEGTTGAVVVGGHTDDTGNAAGNQSLSQERAQAVVDYLAGKGLDAARFTAVGYGSARPVADNSTAAGQAQNRRVEFTLE